jgi:hypothetical protein
MGVDYNNWVRFYSKGMFMLQMARGTGNDAEAFFCELGRWRGALCGRGGGVILL